MLPFSERLIVVGIRWIDAVEALLSIQIDELQLIMCLDPFSQVIEELDNSLSLLRGPIGRDGERECQRQTRRGRWAHALPPRRCGVFFWARSLASLRR
jgi:hypothetical protein